MIPSTQDPRVVSWEGVCQVSDPSAQSFFRFWAPTWKGSVGSKLVLFGVCQWEIWYCTCFGFLINTIRRAAMMVALFWLNRVGVGRRGGEKNSAFGKNPCVVWRQGWVNERNLRKQTEKKMTQSCKKSGTTTNQHNARFFAQDMQIFCHFSANIARFFRYIDQNQKKLLQIQET